MELDSVVVSDDQGVTVTFQSGDTDSDSILDIGETWVYTATGSAGIAGTAYTNVGSVTADDPLGNEVTDTDSSTYTSANPSLSIEKSTNGVDADSLPGVIIAPGGVITWTYTVANTGNVELDTVVVVDDQGVTVTFQSGDTDSDSILDVGETWVYTASGTAGAAGTSYTNVGSVTADDPLGTEVSDTDSSNYTSTNPSLTIEKTTNGVDADSAPGVILSAGDAITWTYTVANTGNVELDNVVVSDDQGVTVAFQSGDTDSDSILDIGETWVYTATGTAGVAGTAYTNVGSVTADDPLGTEVNDTDSSSYTSTNPSLTIEKSTNGTDADALPGLILTAGDAITWTYTVANTGNVALDNVVVSDDQGVTVTFQSGDTDSDSILDVGETWIYTASGSAGVAGTAYTNIGSVTADDPLGTEVNDTDSSSYTSTNPSLTIEKSTNGIDADTLPGAILTAGDAITWTYTVTNSGNVELDSVVVVDDQGVTVTFQSGDTDSDSILDVGESWIYTATGTAGVAGTSYTNVGSVTANDPLGTEVSDTDSSNYTSTNPGLSIEKSTNGVDADTLPGVILTAGDAITWTYTVAVSYTHLTLPTTPYV